MSEDTPMEMFTITEQQNKSDLAAFGWLSQNNGLSDIVAAPLPFSSVYGASNVGATMEIPRLNHHLGSEFVVSANNSLLSGSDQDKISNHLNSVIVTENPFGENAGMFGWVSNESVMDASASTGSNRHSNSFDNNPFGAFPSEDKFSVEGFQNNDLFQGLLQIIPEENASQNELLEQLKEQDERRKKRKKRGGKQEIIHRKKNRIVLVQDQLTHFSQLDQFTYRPGELIEEVLMTDYVDNGVRKKFMKSDISFDADGESGSFALFDGESDRGIDGYAINNGDEHENSFISYQQIGQEAPLSAMGDVSMDNSVGGSFGIGDKNSFVDDSFELEVARDGSSRGSKRYSSVVVPWANFAEKSEPETLSKTGSEWADIEVKVLSEGINNVSGKKSSVPSDKVSERSYLAFSGRDYEAEQPLEEAFDKSAIEKISSQSDLEGEVLDFVEYYKNNIYPEKRALFSDLVPQGKNRKEIAAKAFYNLLILSTKSYITMEQLRDENHPYEMNRYDIEVKFIK
jgi:hypothetical protein